MFCTEGFSFQKLVEHGWGHQFRLLKKQLMGQSPGEVNDKILGRWSVDILAQAATSAQVARDSVPERAADPPPLELEPGRWLSSASLRAPAATTTPAARRTRGNSLSNATCPTHVFFRNTKNAAKPISRIRQVMP